MAFSQPWNSPMKSANTPGFKDFLELSSLQDTGVFMSETWGSLLGSPFASTAQEFLDRMG